MEETVGERREKTASLKEPHDTALLESHEKSPAAHLHERIDW
jgi:hypothetical protein